MRRSSHSVTELHYHIVLVTKYRRPVLTGNVAETVKGECTRIIEHFEGSVVEVETDVDHIHLLVDMPPKYAMSEVVNVLKGVSSRIARRDHLPEIQEHLKGGSLWSPSYYLATSGGVTLETLKEYVRSQSDPQHRNKKQKAAFIPSQTSNGS